MVCGSAAASSVFCTIAHWPMKSAEPRLATRRACHAKPRSGRRRPRCCSRSATRGRRSAGRSRARAGRWSRRGPASTGRPAAGEGERSGRPWSGRSATSGFARHPPGGGASTAGRAASDSAMAWPIAHMPVPSSDTSTVVASPVRSRWNSAPMIPPAIVMAPIESPNPGAGGDGTRSYSGRMMPIAIPARPRTPASRTSPGRRRDRARPARAADVDDVRVVGADLLDVDLQLGAQLGSLLVRKTSHVAASR